MLYQEWDMERALEVRAQEAAEQAMKKGLEKGMEKGLAEGRRMVIRKLVQKLSTEEIADITGLSLKDVQKILDVQVNQG